MLYVLSITSYVCPDNAQLRYTTFKVQCTRCPTKKSVDNLLPLISLPIPLKLYRTSNEVNTKQYSVKTKNCQLLIILVAEIIDSF